MVDGLESASASARQASSAFSAAIQFLGRRWLPVSAISTLILIPCFWQRRIQAGDLASHVYNAWLAQLIERGEVPGLWIARQSNNVLFDLTLHTLGNRLGLLTAERIAVSVAVLLFFWSAFALASAAARGAAWLVLPCLAMVAYGWTFQMGFFNYYVSLGFAFFGLALLWRGRSWERGAALVLVPLIWLAHPLGLVLLACAGAWIIVAEKLSLRGQCFAGLAAIAALICLRFYIVGRYQVFGSSEPRYMFNGVDQLLLYGPQYRLPVVLLMAVVLLSLFSSGIWRHNTNERRRTHLVPVQLYGLALLAIVLLPETIILPQYAAPAGFLRERLSCICAVFACCALASLEPRKWHLAGFSTVAVVFFFQLYTDTAKINRMEEQAERIVQSIPASQLVLATVPPPAGSRIFVFHIVDRACIGHCFSFGNYEPGSEQFRVRANPGNRFVTTAMNDSFAIQRGEYKVRPQDLPIFQINPCGSGSTELCIRELTAGEVNVPDSGRPAISIPSVPAPVR